MTAINYAEKAPDGKLPPCALPTAIVGGLVVGKANCNTPGSPTGRTFRRGRGLVQ